MGVDSKSMAVHALTQIGHRRVQAVTGMDGRCGSFCLHKVFLSWMANLVEISRRGDTARLGALECQRQAEMSCSAGVARKAVLILACWSGVAPGLVPITVQNIPDYLCRWDRASAPDPADAGGRGIDRRFQWHRESGVREGTPGGHWQTVTMLGAISSEGWLATMTVCAPTDVAVFLACRREVFCPALRPGQIVMMDKLAAPNVQGVGAGLR